MTRDSKHASSKHATLLLFSLSFYREAQVRKVNLLIVISLDHSSRKSNEK